MKLVVAMAIEEHRDVLRGMFRDHQVVVYSEAPIEGFRPAPGPTDPGNWFVSRPDGVFSHIVFAFVEDGTAAVLLDAVRDWNGRERPTNPMHAFQLGVERSS
jgi:hypothetical protein